MKDDFEKNINDSLNNPPEFPFEENLWKDMENRLDDTEKESRPSNMIWWLPFLLLMAIIPSLLAGFFYAKQIESKKEITNLEMQIKKYKHTVKDSTIQKHVTIVYDTIYNYTTIYKTIHSSKSNTASPTQIAYSPFPLKSFFKFNAISDLSNADNSGYFKWNQPSSQIFDPFSKNQNSFVYSSEKETANNTFANKTPLALLASLPYSFLTYDNNVQLPILVKNIVEDKKQKKNLDYYLLKLRPKALTLSASGGILTSLNNYYEAFNFIGKLQAEVYYSPQFSFVLGVDYLSFNFESKEKETKEFPIQTPNADTDILNEIKGKFTYLQIPFGLKYTFRSNKKLHPFLGVGLLSQKNLKSDLTYNYNSINNEYEINKNNVLAKTFQVSDFWTSLGFQYEWTNNWNLFLAFHTQFSLKKKEFKYENHQFLGGNVGLQYRFQ